MVQYYDKKKCVSCDLEKEITCFSVRKDSKDGYRNQCKVCTTKQKNINKIKNYEKYELLRKEWVSKNKDKIKINIENFYTKNPLYRKEYQKNNKEKINLRNKLRRKNDVIFKLNENIRNLIKNSIKYKGIKKNTKTINILGCTYKEFKEHIESLWEPWMNWGNYGNPKDGIIEPNKTWDFDHIIPKKNGSTEEEVIKLNHYSNIQPLCSYYNRKIKKDK
jgi:hypothetical protein